MTKVMTKILVMQKKLPDQKLSGKSKSVTVCRVNGRGSKIDAAAERFHFLKMNFIKIYLPGCIGLASMLLQIHR